MTPGGGARPQLPLTERRLRSWLRRQGLSARRLEPLEGDVSPRRYARLESDAGERLVLAHYPAELRPVCRRFLKTTALLEEIEVRVPAVRAADCERGLMLLEDLGGETLYDLRRLPIEERLPWFEAAAELCSRIASRLSPRRVAALNPPLDEALLRRELAQTVDVFLVPRGLAGGGALRRRLEEAFDLLCRNLAAAAPLPCHRDFMARNLVPLEADPAAADGSPASGGPPSAALAVLDHQDLRLGPPFYDLASLLNDSFFPPPEIERRLLGERLAAAGDRRAFARAAAQRALKAVGTFAAFAERGSPRHLRLIPPTLARALRHLAELPEGSALAGRLEPSWRPVIEGGGELLTGSRGGPP